MQGAMSNGPSRGPLAAERPWERRGPDWVQRVRARSSRHAVPPPAVKPRGSSNGHVGSVSGRGANGAGEGNTSSDRLSCARRKTVVYGAKRITPNGIAEARIVGGRRSL